MRVLVTQASADLPRYLAESLAARHEVRRSDERDIDHSAATNGLVRGVDVVVHAGALGGGVTASQQLDYAMRCTYNLLRAAVEEGAPRFVYLSTLRLMEGYEAGLAVTERWRTLPTTEPSVLACQLGELVCREFAREGKINVVVLRLGEITAEGEEAGASALYLDDAAGAVEAALSAELSGWLDVFHVQSDVPDGLFLVGQPWWSSDDVSPPVSLGWSPRLRGSSSCPSTELRT